MPPPWAHLAVGLGALRTSVGDSVHLVSICQDAVILAPAPALTLSLALPLLRTKKQRLYLLEGIQEFKSNSQGNNTTSVYCAWILSVSLWVINYQCSVPVTCKTDMSCTEVCEGSGQKNRDKFWKFKIKSARSVLKQMTRGTKLQWLNLVSFTTNSTHSTWKNKLTRPNVLSQLRSIALYCTNFELELVPKVCGVSNSLRLLS